MAVWDLAVWGFALRPPFPLMMNARRPAETGLLLIGHGTRSKEGVAQCIDLSRQVASSVPQMEVKTGFIELAEPGLTEAIDDLAAKGVSKVVAVPLVLLPAGHLKLDGPAALSTARARHPRIDFFYGRDLGTHPLVLATAQDQISATAAGLCGPDIAVVLVGRGSTDPDANAELYKVSRLLADSRSIQGLATAAKIAPDPSGTVPVSGTGVLSMIEPAFVSLAPPSVPQALERCVRLGASKIAVVPYFLFAGVLIDRIKSQVAQWATSNPQARIHVGKEMAGDSRLVEVVLERAREALIGGAAMNCDCCIYKVALPGYRSNP